MKSTRLNNTDTEISVIGLGAMPLSLSGRPPEEEAIKVLHRAYDLGVTLIDTADSYCIDESDKHHNEQLIHKSLTSYEGDAGTITVATKGGLMRDGGAWNRDGDPDHLREAIRRSFETLGGEQPIRLWQFHAPDPDHPISRSLLAAAEAQEEGLIRHVGISNVSLEEIEEAETVLDVVSVQNEYSPWYRVPEKTGVLDYCEEHGITFFPHRPLGGRDRAKRVGELDGISEISNERDVSPQQVTLAWHRAKSSVVVPIPGVSRVESVEDSVRAADLELTDDEVDLIDRTTDIDL